MKKSGSILNWCILIFGVACIAYYLSLGIFVRFGQSLMYLWLIVGLLCVGRFFYWRHVYKSGKYPPKKPVRVLRVFFCAALCFFLAVEGAIFTAGFSAAPGDLDYIIVLGAKVNGREPSGALRNRIQVAAEYLAANLDTLAILSGGQGSDEEISEAQCMFENLVSMGIDPARLILEDQSTDTSENLIFSRTLIPEEDVRIGLVTNTFHIFRSLGLARALGIQAEGVPVATSWISVPHYYMREFVGVVYDGLRGNLAL